MSTTLQVIQGCRIEYARDIFGHEFVYFTADADIDCDGSGGNPDHDPYFQPDTSLHGPDGHALNAYHVPFVVVPPVVCTRTQGKVLGAECLLTNTVNGRKVLCVVGDIGPTRKIGEISPAAAIAIGLNPNANHGGTSMHVIDYEIRINKPAVINGVAYHLQPYR